VQLEDYFDFLAPDDIRIKGHRLGIESVLYEYIYRSQTAEEIARRFETLSLDQVYATILYYLRNREAVSQYMADWWEYCQHSAEKARAEDPGFYEKMRSLKEAARSGPQRSSA
jgi:uncharacterized protein (DUF433 family)